MKYLVLIVIFLVILRIFYLRLHKIIENLEQEKRNLLKEKEIAFKFLEKTAKVLLSGEKLDKRLEEVGEFIVEALNADSGAIFLRYKENYMRASAIFGSGIFPPLLRTIDKVFTHKKFIKEKLLRDVVPIEDAKIIGYVLETGQSQIINDARKDPRIPKAATDFVDIKSMLLAPLKIKDKTMGVCVLVNKRDGARFTEEDRSMFENLVNYAALILDLIYMSQEIQEKQRLEQEIALANEIQQLLLPAKVPSIEGYDIYSYNKPAKELGGDYYDFIELADDKIGITIADVSGKGVGAALVMATLRSFLRLKAKEYPNNPVKLMEDLNELMYHDTKENMFITMIYGILDTKSNIFKFVRAGHEQVMVFSPNKKEPDVYVPKGMALGIGDKNIFFAEEVSINLKSGDLIILYTDGVTEAMNKEGEEYGLERFKKKIKEVSHLSAETIFAEVLYDLKKMTGDIPQHDDITAVLIKKL